MKWSWEMWKRKKGRGLSDITVAVVRVHSHDFRVEGWTSTTKVLDSVSRVGNGLWYGSSMVRKIEIKIRYAQNVKQACLLCKIDVEIEFGEFVTAPGFFCLSK